MEKKREKTNQFGDIIPFVAPSLDFDETIDEILAGLGITYEQIVPAFETAMPSGLDEYEGDIGHHWTNMVNEPILLRIGEVKLQDTKKYIAVGWFPIEIAEALVYPAVEKGSLCSRNFYRCLAKYREMNGQGD